MTTNILSDSSAANFWKLNLCSTFSPEALESVAGDNTSAAGGAYNSYNTLKNSGNNILRSLSDDATRIDIAGAQYEDADATGARSFR